MTRGAWARRSWPASYSDGHLVGRWEPATPAELTVHRRELSAVLHDGERPADADECAVERLVLVVEELVSNALRYGSPPVSVEIIATGHFWLLDVSDAAVARPPALAVGRDAAHGGLGLYLVAALCGAHGWTVAHNRKHVWARVDYRNPEVPDSGFQAQRS
jgi:two-component sensor histidine kinase